MPMEVSKAVSDSSIKPVLCLNEILLIDLTAVSLAPDDLAQLKTQNQLADAWKSVVPSFPQDCIHVLPSIEHGVRIVRGVTEGESPVKVLVAGSLHLVGGVIEVADLAETAL